jgi:hypothetical protein
MRLDREALGIVEAVEQAGKQVGVSCWVHARFPRPQGLVRQGLLDKAGQNRGLD